MEETRLRLADLTDESFTEIVNEDVRDKLDPDTAAALRQPDVADRWYNTLLSFKRAVEAQLASANADKIAKQAELLPKGKAGKVLWLQFKAVSDKKRQGALRFKNGVEDRLAEAKSLRRATHTDVLVGALIHERDDAFREMTRLRRAILEHRSAVEASAEDDDVVDDRLWAAIDAGLKSS